MYFRPDEIQDFFQLVKEHKFYTVLGLLLIVGVIWFNWSQHFRFRKMVNHSKYLISSLYLIIAILNVFYLMFTTYKGSEPAQEPDKNEHGEKILKRSGTVAPARQSSTDNNFQAKLRTMMNKVKTRKQIRNVSNLKKKVVAAKQHWKCGNCGELLDETYEVDHIIPLYQGGTNDLENLMALDPRCHKKKTFQQQYL